MSTLLKTNEEWRIIECSQSHSLVRCFPVIRQLRTDLSEQVFLERTLMAIEQNRYSVYAIESEESVLAVVGFRILIDLCWGRNLYVDDLVVAEGHRHLGLGSHLMHFAEEQARKYECDFVRLASGLSRLETHRFYESLGYRKSSFQFVKKSP